MKIVLSEKIKELRQKKGVTQKQFADALLVTPQSVSRWENGQVHPDIELLPRIAEFFEVSVDELLKNDGSFVRQKRRELAEARKQVRGENDHVALIRVCRILEQLASHGDDVVEFLTEARTLCRRGIVGQDTVDRAREYCRQKLLSLDAERRIFLLMTVLSGEDEEDVGRWREFITGNSFSCCWDDVLLWRYFHNRDQNDKWEAQRQKVVYDAVCKLILNMVNETPSKGGFYDNMTYYGLNSYEHYRMALDTLNVYSRDAGDVFIELRLHVEIRMAAALFASGRNEQGFAVLELLGEHVTTLRGLLGKTRRGSVAALSLVEQQTDEDLIRIFIGNISFFLHRAEFDGVREDARFVSFFHSVLGMRPEEEPVLAEMHRAAQRIGIAENDLVLMVRTSQGKVRHAVIHGYSDSEQRRKQETAFAEALREAGEDEIRYILCLYPRGVFEHSRKGGLELASADFCRALCQINRENTKAGMLLGAEYRYRVCTVAQAYSADNASEGRSMNDSYVRLARAVARWIVAEAGNDKPILEQQLKMADVGETRMYRRGFNMRFHLREGAPTLPFKATKTLGEVSATVKGLERGMGFILWVKDGLIQSLEGYSYDEPLPERVDLYRLHGKQHVVSTAFCVTGDFDLDEFLKQLDTTADRVWKKGELNPISKQPMAFCFAELGRCEARGEDLNINELIRNTLKKLMPHAEMLAQWRERDGLCYSLAIKGDLVPQYPEASPSLSLDPDIIAFLHTTGTRHELDIVF